VRRTPTTDLDLETRFSGQGVSHPGNPPEQPDYLGRDPAVKPNRSRSVASSLYAVNHGMPCGQQFARVVGHQLVAVATSPTIDPLMLVEADGAAHGLGHEFATIAATASTT
jgi:hypothetical protein